MKRNEKFSVVFVTAPDIKESRKIASGILKSRLAACVNIVEKIESHYRWQGKIETASECLLIIKTKKSLSKKLIEKIKLLHSYSVPEIIFLPVTDGSQDYLSWIKKETI